jgi:hypothetical protein
MAVFVDDPPIAERLAASRRPRGSARIVRTSRTTSTLGHSAREVARNLVSRLSAVISRRHQSDRKVLVEQNLQADSCNGM